MHIWPLIENKHNNVFVLRVCEKPNNLGTLVKDFEIATVLHVILTCWALHILNRFQESLFDHIFEMKFLGHHFTKDLVLIIDLKQEGHDQKCTINTSSFAIVNDLEEEFEI